MKKKKMIFEITLILVAGLITLYVSVSSIIKAEKHEKELKENQKRLNEKSDTIIALQTKMQEKSDKVIELQNELIKTSISQTQDINKLRNPVPSELEVSFASEIVTSKEELIQIDQALQSTRGDRGNLLPTDFAIENEGVKRINILKDILITLNIEFTSGNKKMTIYISKVPQYEGYHKIYNARFDNFTLALMRDKEKLELHGLFLTTQDIRFNYAPSSILDFNHSKVVINYSFNYPHLMKRGDITSKRYINTDREYMKLKISTVRIYHRDFNINFTQLRKVDDFTFEAEYNIDNK